MFISAFFTPSARVCRCGKVLIWVLVLCTKTARGTWPTMDLGVFQNGWFISKNQPECEILGFVTVTIEIWLSTFNHDYFTFAGGSYQDTNNLMIRIRNAVYPTLRCLEGNWWWVTDFGEFFSDKPYAIKIVCPFGSAKWWVWTLTRLEIAGFPCASNLWNSLQPYLYVSFCLGVEMVIHFHRAWSITSKEIVMMFHIHRMA